MRENDRLSEYLHSLEPDGDKLLMGLRNYAVTHHIPIVRPETESFLRSITAIRKPSSILEIGTAIAYSTIVMASVSEASIDTIESFEKRIGEARANIRAAHLEGRINVIEGDAGKLLPRMADGLESGKGGYDMIFLDAAKGQYLVWLPDILRLMKPESVLVADNVLQDETVIESRFAVARRERSTHVRMREFLYRLKHDDRLITSIVPVGDGVSISVMKA